MDKLEGIKLGVFDNSGVLSDDRPPVYEANMILMDRHSLKRMSFQEWLDNTKTTAGEFLISRGVDRDEDELNDEYHTLYTEITTRKRKPITAKMYKGVPEVLEGLRDRGLKLAVLSKHPIDRLEAELRGYGIRQYFDLVMGDPEDKPRRLLEIFSTMKVGASRAFFVEDSIYGVRDAHKVRVPCFGVTTGYHNRKMLEEEEPFQVIDSLSEISWYLE